MTVYKGWNATIYKDGVSIGNVVEVSLSIDAGLETYYEAGHRELKQVIPGSIGITGKMSRAWIDTKYLILVSGSSLSDFTLYMKVSTAFGLYIYHCSLKTGTYAIPQDGFLKEDYDFVAKTVTAV